VQRSNTIRHSANSQHQATAAEPGVSALVFPEPKYCQVKAMSTLVSAPGFLCYPSLAINRHWMPRSLTSPRKVSPATIDIFITPSNVPSPEYAVISIPNGKSHFSFDLAMTIIGDNNLLESDQLISLVDRDFPWVRPLCYNSIVGNPQGDSGDANS